MDFEIDKAMRERLEEVAERGRVEARPVGLEAGLRVAAKGPTARPAHQNRLTAVHGGDAARRTADPSLELC